MRGALAKVGTGLVLGACAVAVLLAGARPLAGFVTVLYLLAYLDCRRIFGPPGSLPTLGAGGGAVVALSWFASVGQPERLPLVMGGLVVAVLALWVLQVEAGRRPAAGATADVAATLAAAGLVGLLGAHLLLIRAVPRFGFRGALVFGLMVISNNVAAYAAGTLLGRHRLAPRISPRKTWEGVACGAAASLAVGLVAGATLSPPFTFAWGAALAGMVAVLAPVGDLAASALKRDAGLKDAGRYLPGVGGALDLLDNLLFTAPFFYWAFRTLVV